MDLLAKLTELGFTEYEAKVYLALLDDYPASGYQISKTAGVPRSMVYEALGRLKLRGAVLETPDERATLYREPAIIVLQTDRGFEMVFRKCANRNRPLGGVILIFLRLSHKRLLSKMLTASGLNRGRP